MELYFRTGDKAPEFPWRLSFSRSCTWAALHIVIRDARAPPSMDSVPDAPAVLRARSLSSRARSVLPERWPTVSQS